VCGCPLAYLLTLAGVSLAILTTPEGRVSGGPWTAGFFTGLLAWTKNEGMLLSLMLIVTFTMFQVGVPEGRRRLRLVVFGAALPWVAVITFKVGWLPHSDLSAFLAAPWTRASSLERWAVVGKSFVDRLNPVSSFLDWGPIWAVAIVGFALGLGTGTWRRRPLCYVLAVVGCSWLTWFGVFVATPLDVEWHVRTALDRLMLQLLPLTLVAAVAVLSTTSEPQRGR